MMMPGKYQDAATPVALGEVPERTRRELVALLAHLGDELGLFRDLATNRPSTCPEIAKRTQLDESSVSDWLAAMIDAGYVECDTGTLRFSVRAGYSGAA